MNKENNDIFDVAVIGAGVVGAAVARCLSAYDLKVVVLEKNADVGFGVSKANSGIVHAGFHHSMKTLKAKLEVKGNLMFEELQHELNFPFKRCGIVVAAFSEEEMETVRALYRNGVENGVPGIELCGRERLLSLEPKLSGDVHGGLHAPSGGVVEPYRFVFSLIESAKLNGLELKLEFEVVESSYQHDCYTIKSAFGETVCSRYVVNAAGLYADQISKIIGGEEFTISPRKGEEYLLDRNSHGHPSHVIFPVPSATSKGMLVIPTVEGTTMVGPTAEMVKSKEDTSSSHENLERIFNQAVHMVPGISIRDIITAFAGLRPVLEGNDFYIDISRKSPRLIQVAGIQSPGLTASPAIAEYVKSLLKKAGLVLTEKTEFISEIPKFMTVRNKDYSQIQKLIAADPAYGNIVCRCELISEGEIVEAIRRGHTTVDGIKFYTRAGMGRCQGGFCSYKILKIISRETGIPIEKITKRGKGSRILKGKLSGEILS